MGRKIIGSNKECTSTGAELTMPTYEAGSFIGLIQATSICSRTRFVLAGQSRTFGLKDFGGMFARTHWRLFGGPFSHSKNRKGRSYQELLDMSDPVTVGAERAEIPRRADEFQHFVKPRLKTLVTDLVSNLLKIFGSEIAGVLCLKFLPGPIFSPFMLKISSRADVASQLRYLRPRRYPQPKSKCNKYSR